MGYILIELGANFMENYIFYDIVCLIFKKKKQYFAKISLSVFLTIVMAILNRYAIISYINMLIIISLWGMTSLVTFKEPLKHVIPIVLFYSLIIYVIDSIVLVVWGIITEQPKVLTIISKVGNQRICFVIIDKIIFVAVYLLVRKWLKKNFRENKFLVFITIGGFCGGIFLTRQMQKQIDIDIAISWIFLLIIVILLLVIAYSYLVRQREKETLEFADMRNQLLEDNYSNLKTLYEANAKLFHDFKHHIRVMNELINRNQMEELKEYISGFQLEDFQSNNVQWTEDIVVNIILNNKISIGKQKGIEINAEIDYPLKTSILSKDITTILANLFDNALEACDRISEEQDKWIHITIKKVNNILFIKMENSCSEKPVNKGREFVSRKGNQQMHGWGLKSIETTASKYNGAITCKYSKEKQLFRSVVSLFFEEIEITNEHRGV